MMRLVGKLCVFTAALTAVGGRMPLRGAETLSLYTSSVFVPDGNIQEFVNNQGDSQGYFITDPSDPEFGRTRCGAVISPGVTLAIDPLPPAGSSTAASPSGFFDYPCRIFSNAPLPTGFNIGRALVSYNPSAFGGEGAFFLAMDISAPRYNQMLWMAW